MKKNVNFQLINRNQHNKTKYAGYKTNKFNKINMMMSNVHNNNKFIKTAITSHEIFLYLPNLACISKIRYMTAINVFEI